MSGIGLVLNVAKDALLTQQYAIDVVSHNITNVSTEGYTRQSPILEAKDAAPYGGFIFGRGVELNDIIRNANEFIEKRLQDSQSDLLAMTEKGLYMGVIESIFDENSGRSISNQMVDFWNAWNDLSNNPSGHPERILLAENATLLTECFRDLSSDLIKLDQEIDKSIQAGIGEVNQILTQIADINKQILVLEVSGNANDLRDQRNMLVNKLSKYIDLNTYEYDDGNLTVTTGRGYILVNRGDTYPLNFDGNDVIWESSVSSEINITDTITGGKLGGWLDIRDEVIPKYSDDLNELAKTVIWETNMLHSQGVGLDAFTTVTGTYSVANRIEPMGASASELDFYDKITDGSFKLWIYDSSDTLVGSKTIAVDASVMTLDDLVSEISAVDPDITAAISDDRLQITASNGHSFAFSDDSSNVLATLGVNTFFTSAGARDMGVNKVIITDKNNIAAGKITDGAFYPGDNSNAFDIADLQYQDVSMKRWTYTRGETATCKVVKNTTMDDYYHLLVGSIGIESQSITREKEYKAVIQTQISSTRDNISAVSLDEEMANLIKYQHAYVAAAKLITVAEEMLDTLLNTTG